MVKVTFLGTSHGVPSDERYCSCEMIDVNGNLYLIDGGAPVVDLLQRRHVDFSKIKAIFNTHFHADHVFGLLPFLSLSNWHHRWADFDIYLTEQKGIDAVKALLIAGDGGLDEERLRFHLQTEGTFYDDGTVKVTAFPTMHMADSNRPAYSLLIEADGKKLFFTGDLSHNLVYKDYPKYVMENKVDFLQSELVHFTVEEGIPYFEKCKCAQLCFTHFAEAYKPFIEAFGSRFGYPAYTAKDGDTITL